MITRELLGKPDEMGLITMKEHTSSRGGRSVHLLIMYSHYDNYASHLDIQTLLLPS